ncbi:hypothetical protein K490DRAFT_45638 [Saccharata proteae CBS 121410]|uniref:Aspergillopepsin n=1 Tax=Saccharata proteae CBS 121410 TaxID=1314787 RepID=A0A9P4LYH6_9PEZI|nr:hypothetical protein K490DRAFT_45638 [Saccharata proteae CBS 121410]
MKFSAIFSGALLASLAAAAPHARAGPQERESRLAKRVARREAATRTGMSKPMAPVAAADLEEEGLINSTHISYSSNWAGAVYEEPPSGTFTAVAATITVPVPSATAVGTYSASAWVGIDGDTYGNAILQTGVDFTAKKTSSTTKTSFDAWYEWYPDYAYDFSLDVDAGDVIYMSVTSTSSKAGKAVIENLTTGKTVTKSLTSSSALGGENAEWIVEDYESGGSLVNFADFGTVLFTGATAKTNTETVGTSDASIIEIKQSKSVLTTVTIPSSSEVKVVYA